MHHLVLIAALLLLSACEIKDEVVNEPHGAPDFAVATAHPLATQAGIEILQHGGNAFDAAVAVTATLAVVEPYSSGLGGGGFWLLHIAENNRDIMIDGRETAPLAATHDMYLDTDGTPTNQSVEGPLAAGIPGVPAGIVHIAQNYGSLPLDVSLKFAIQTARNGFAIDDRYHQHASTRLDTLLKSSQAASIFLDRDKPPSPGYILKQPQLATVLEHIRDFGADGFYQGDIANQFVDGVQRAGGIWQLEDLQQYRIKERQPITGSYKNLNIVSAAPPSSGGIVLVQMLNMLSMLELAQMETEQRIHAIVEVMRRAYSERAKYLGDTDFVHVPINRLLSKNHSEKLLADFDLHIATKSQDYLNDSLQVNEQELPEGQNTTHFSIIDQAGNYVAATLSINFPFGSGFVPAGTGVVLNNEMDDFVIQPGHPNLWGLIGNEANAIEPGKRMLSSMSPTFLYDEDRVAVLGTPGGSRIISMVLLSTLEFAKGADALSLVKLPRFHHQFLPDQIQFESDAIDDATQTTLTNMGHQLHPMQRRYGNMHAIVWNKKTKQITAASDPRGIGRAQVGE